jgi:putative SOS response-associated peptidase YedK
MCGRVRLSSDYSEIKIRLKFAPNSVAPNFEPDWNKPPTAPMLVAIRSVNGERVPRMMKWGLIPHWAKDDKLQYSTFNARAEEFTTKPAFRDAWSRGQRCLVVTDGFYEWKKLDPKGKLKQPHAIAMADNAQNGDGRSVGEMEIADERRRSFKLHDFDVRAEQGDGRAARPNAGHSRGDRLAEVVR